MTGAKRRLDFDDLAGIIGAPPDTTETATPEQREQAAELEAEGRLIPNTELDTEAWGKLNADIRFEGREVLAPNLPIENLSSHVVLRDRRLVIDPGRADIAGGHVEMTADLDGSAGPVDGSFDINIERLQLQFDRHVTVHPEDADQPLTTAGLMALVKEAQ